MYTEKYILVKNVYKSAKLLKVDRNSIQDEDRPDWPTMTSKPEVVDSVFEFISVDYRVHL